MNRQQQTILATEFCAWWTITHGDAQSPPAVDRRASARILRAVKWNPIHAQTVANRFKTAPAFMFNTTDRSIVLLARQIQTWIAWAKAQSRADEIARDKLPNRA